jgi:hypothetical protein
VPLKSTFTDSRSAWDCGIDLGIEVLAIFDLINPYACMDLIRTNLVLCCNFPGFAIDLRRGRAR